MHCLVTEAQRKECTKKGDEFYHDPIIPTRPLAVVDTVTQGARMSYLPQNNAAPVVDLSRYARDKLRSTSYCLFVALETLWTLAE